jgi:ribosome maturation factor RimP
MPKAGVVPGDNPSVTRTETATLRVEELAAPILWSHGLELVEVVCVGKGPGTVVRVFIDKPGGVSLTDCEQAHRALSPALDVADPFPHAYTLEVSSPGLDRPLRAAKDYLRLVGERVSIKLREPRQGQWRLTGTLEEVREEGITLVVPQKKTTESVQLTFEQIASGRQDVEF